MRDPGFLSSAATRCNHHATFQIRADFFAGVAHLASELQAARQHRLHVQACYF